MSRMKYQGLVVKYDIDRYNFLVKNIILYFINIVYRIHKSKLKHFRIIVIVSIYFTVIIMLHDNNCKLLVWNSRIQY